MPRFHKSVLVLLILGVIAEWPLARGDEKPFGVDKRTPWTTSNFRGTPDPPPPFRAERIYPKIHFRSPTVITSAPGTDRFFVGEQYGKVFSVSADREQEQPDPFLDANELVKRLAERTKADLVLDGLYGLTFHPKFAENRYCYLCYVVRERNPARGKQYPDGTRVARLEVSRTDPPTVDLASEVPVITWLQGGHNGGCLKFGPDGCLYISSGDGGNAFPPDMHNSGQDMTSLLGKVMRIDVDHPADGKMYSIPADNPFVKLDKARGEIWAYGLRNPWKMSFDRRGGSLWVGDVGWELWEMIYRVGPGANYGWSLMEGPQPVHAERQRGPTPIVPPTISISHSDGVSITGGFVYRGKKFPELEGTYLFGDWETRWIWGAKLNGDKVGPRQDFVEPTVRIIDFAEDNDGEVYLLDYDDGTIHELARNDGGANRKFPRLLSDTGLLASVEKHEPAAGVIPFDVNASMWADGATAERFLAIPGEESIRLHERPKQIPGSMFQRQMDWPKDSVLVKTLSLAMKAGDPGSRRRIETQVLHYDGKFWRGYSYKWNETQTDAALVDAAGTQQAFQIADDAWPVGKRQHSWQFSSRTDCIRCHNQWAEYSLAFNVPQLNRDHDFGGMIDNQLRTLRHIGVFVDVKDDGDKTEINASPKSPEKLPRLHDPLDESASLNDRARSYLHVNCAHCHRTGGGGSAFLHLPFDLPLDETKALDRRPTQGTFNVAHAQIIASGEPFKSLLFLRIAKLGAGRMPHIGSQVVDAEGLKLVHDWITELPRQKLADDGRGPEAEASVAERLATPESAAALALQLHLQRMPDLRERSVAAAMKHSDSVVRYLFEPFVPEEKRAKRLGETVRPEQILTLSGNMDRGRKLFHETATVQCKNCHRIGEGGTALGPELTQIGKKYSRAELLESILEPSKKIDPPFATWLVETSDGKVLSGLLAERNDREAVLKTADGKSHLIPSGDIERMVPQQKSLMPELLVRDMSAEQVADLLAYLASLR